MITLRPYQESAKRAVYSYLRDKTGNPCVVIPTGGGKTPLIASICSDAVQVWGGRVLIVAHVKELLEQSAAKLREMAPTLRFGIYSAGLKRRDTTQDVIIGGVQSIFEKADILGRFDLLIIDEAHLIPPDGYGRYQTLINDLVNINENIRIIGLTATAYRTDTGRLCTKDGILNDVCYEVSVKELIVRGYLTKLTSKAARNEIDTSTLKIVRGEYDDKQAESAFMENDVVKQSIDEILLKTRDRKSVLIFCQTVDHAVSVANLLRWSGERCHEIYGDTPSAERASHLDDFKRGDPRYMVNVNVLTTGFDHPGIDCVCLLRATTSAGLFYQMCGRGFRLADGKLDCLILDFGGNIKKHGPIDLIEPKDKKKGDEGPKGKTCPSCSEVVAIAVMVCPSCGYQWEPVGRDLTQGGSAERDEPISKEPEITEREVESVTYRAHVKKNAPEGHPRTLRVDYQVSNPVEWFSEWVCVEHPNGGFARNKAEDWWAARCQTADDCPHDADEAVDLADEGKLRSPLRIKIKTTPGERFPQIIGHVLPDQQDDIENAAELDFDVSEFSSVPKSMPPDHGEDLSEIPF